MERLSKDFKIIYTIAIVVMIIGAIRHDGVTLLNDFVTKAAVSTFLLSMLCSFFFIYGGYKENRPREKSPKA